MRAKNKLGWGPFGTAVKMQSAGTPPAVPAPTVTNAGTAKWHPCDDGQWWSGFLSAAVALSANFKAAGTISYQAGPNNEDDQWVGAAGLYYYPTARSEIGAELLWNGPESGDDTLGGHLRFKTHFN